MLAYSCKPSTDGDSCVRPAWKTKLMDTINQYITRNKTKQYKALIIQKNILIKIPYCSKPEKFGVARFQARLL